MYIKVFIVCLSAAVCVACSIASMSENGEKRLCSKNLFISTACVNGGLCVRTCGFRMYGKSLFTEHQGSRSAELKNRDQFSFFYINAYPNTPNLPSQKKSEFQADELDEYSQVKSTLFISCRFLCLHRHYHHRF